MNLSTTSPETQWLAQHRLLALLHQEQSFGLAWRLFLFVLVLAVWFFSNSQLSGSVLLPLLAGLFVLSAMKV